MQNNYVKFRVVTNTKTKYINSANHDVPSHQSNPWIEWRQLIVVQINVQTQWTQYNWKGTFV